MCVSKPHVSTVAFRSFLLMMLVLWCCGNFETASNTSATSCMFFLCGKYIPTYKRFLYSQHVLTVFEKHDLEKGETALMEGLRALTHSGLPLSQPSPILRRCEKLPLSGPCTLYMVFSSSAGSFTSESHLVLCSRATYSKLQLINMPLWFTIHHYELKL